MIYIYIIQLSYDGFLLLESPCLFSVELKRSRFASFRFVVSGTRAARAPGRGALGQTAGRREGEAGEAAVVPLGE